MGLNRLIFWCCLLVTCDIVLSIENADDDTIVVEAAREEQGRESKDVLLGLPVFQPYQQFFASHMSEDSLKASNSPVTGSCFTGKGASGRCISFRQCYPYFKLFELKQWESWMLGMYNTCEYFTPQGRQMLGVCCTNRPTTEIEKTENNSSSADLPGRYQNNFELSNWPPPIPTHPPDHTIPPIPTHPPNYPNGFTTKATTWPPFTTKPIAAWPTTKLPAWPPVTSRPTSRPPWPPLNPKPTVRPPSWPVSTTKPPSNPTWPSTTAKPTNSPIGISTLHGCGSKNGYQDQERIVGGHNADIGEWPWIAAIFNSGRQFCGGSLIDNIHILSAAHCIAHMSSWDVARLTVRLGDHNIKTNSEVRHVEKRVKRVVRHRGFDSRTLYNDIAILTLDSPVEFTHQIRPICLPSSQNSYAGKTATVIGWGSLRESGPQPAILQEVSIPVWGNQDCRIKYGAAAPGGIVDHMLCAGQAARDSCSGDSGGPLMVNVGRWVQAGIVSWGIGCGKGQYPGVYTRVDQFLSWINKNLN